MTQADTIEGQIAQARRQTTRLAKLIAKGESDLDKLRKTYRDAEARCTELEAHGFDRGQRKVTR